MSDAAKMFNEGSILVDGRHVDVRELPWNEHASFKGVYLKHLITGKDTGGKFSSHIVKVTAGHEIGDHIHAGKFELHEVVDGRGTCVIEGKKLCYKPGIIAIIPEDKKHRVVAEDGDLYLLAKFIPALL